MHAFGYFSTGTPKHCNNNNNNNYNLALLTSAYGGVENTL